MRISDWSSDVCSSDLARRGFAKLDDLSERVIPAEHRTNHPTHAEAVDWVCREAIGRLAVATHSEIAAFFDAITPEEARTWCAAAGPATLRRIEIEHADGPEIGRAPCRDRECQYVEIPVVATSFKKKPNAHT